MLSIPLVVLLLLVLSLVDHVSGQPVSIPTYGLDVSVAFPLKTYECLKRTGYQYVITRAWKNTGEFDPASLKTLSAALAGGFDHMDIYFYPCPRCATDPKKELSGEEQIQQMIKKLHGHEFGNLWIDVEDMETGTVWHKDKLANRVFMDTIVSAATEAVGKNRVGIYAARQYWEKIFGPDYTTHSSLPLWTAGFDDQPNFDDWKPFGGWCSPVMKQYTGNREVCGVKINLNIGVPPSEKKPRWLPSCWSKCHDGEQTRTGKCMRQGLEVSKSVCSRELPFISTRQCPYHTPSCHDIKGASCMKYQSCGKKYRVDGMCENAPSQVCCTKKPTSPPSFIHTKKQPSHPSKHDDHDHDDDHKPNDDLVEVNPPTTIPPMNKKTSTNSDIIQSKQAYVICRPPRHVGVCMMPSDCVNDEDVSIGGYCDNQDMICCAKKTNDD